METLSQFDAGFLRLENKNTSLHMASLSIFEGPPPSYDEVLRLFARKLPLVPRYRQVVRETPLRLGAPLWVDDQHFSLRYHVRHTALPAPGSDAQLRDMFGRLMSQKLDRERPLWEAWIVEGLADGHWAMINKLHHCMADGIGGNDLLALVLDHTGEPDGGATSTGPVKITAGTAKAGRTAKAAGHPAPREATVAEDDWQPTPAPGALGMISNAIADPSTALGVARQLLSAVGRPRGLAEGAFARLRGLLEFGGMLLPAAVTSLSGPVGAARVWNHTRTTVDDVRTVRRALGGSPNDVELAAITRGFRDLLTARHEPPEQHVVRTLVPVSVRTEAEHGKGGNRVSAMVAELPVGVADPVQRLNAVRAELDSLKKSGEREVGLLLDQVTRVTPPLISALGQSAVFSLPQRSVSTVTTNVPGPRPPLFVAGRRLLEIYPYVPIAFDVRIGVAILTYDGVVTFGVTADERSTPDLDVLVHGIDEGMRELIKIAEAAGPAAPAHPSK